MTTQCTHEVERNRTRGQCFRGATEEVDGYAYCWQHARKWRGRFACSRALMELSVAAFRQDDRFSALLPVIPKIDGPRIFQYGNGKW